VLIPVHSLHVTLNKAEVRSSLSLIISVFNELMKDELRHITEVEALWDLWDPQVPIPHSPFLP
jgi:hypothetical protein